MGKARVRFRIRVWQPVGRFVERRIVSAYNELVALEEREEREANQARAATRR